MAAALEAPVVMTVRVVAPPLDLPPMKGEGHRDEAGAIHDGGGTPGTATPPADAAGAAGGASSPSSSESLGEHAGGAAEKDTPLAPTLVHDGGEATEAHELAVGPPLAGDAWSCEAAAALELQEFHELQVQQAQREFEFFSSPGFGMQMPSAPCTCSGLTDRQIIEGLAASDKTYHRLHRAQKRVQALLSGPSSGSGPADAVCVELYGSLALHGVEGQAPPPPPPQRSRGKQHDERAWRQGQQDHRHYVRTDSDVDLVILLRQDVSASDVANRLVDEGSWDLVSQTHVTKFSTTQFTLLGLPDCGGNSHGRGRETPAEVWLDLTCIDSAVPFVRFKRRQEAFRHSFKLVRSQLESSFGFDGLQAFDAYIFLLKAFAAKVSSNALTGFQATCLGLFVLQLGLYELKCCQPTALVMFECFLRFCCAFFSDFPPSHLMHERSYRCCAIDLSAPRLIPRSQSKWRCEMYFLGAEVQLQTKPSERMNVAHSLSPATVCAAAREALHLKCYLEDGECRWR